MNSSKTTVVEPLTFAPLLKERVWGGERLAEFGFVLPRGTPIGEAWVLADLPESTPDGRSVVDHGHHRGRTLREVIAASPRSILGRARAAEEGGFPLLLKLLDARENLSVQVHPTAAYAKAHPGSHLKSEAWIVLDAAPGAVIYKGLHPDVDEARFRRDLADRKVVADLVAVPVKPGDCHYLPSGTCHALGAGILVAEVQTPSDTTFRVYDWDRTGPRQRALHIEESIECIFGPGSRHGEERGVWQARPGDRGATIQSAGFRTTRLCATPHFSIERIDAIAADDGRAGAPAARATLPLATDDAPVAWMVLDGSVTLAGGNDVRRLGRGRTVLIPAALRGWEAEFSPGASILRIEVPTASDRMIAERR
ncbi:MAG: type I phosphomannose isomerase catalytic subunit [Phycisphaerales bacterium]